MDEGTAVVLWAVIILAIIIGGLAFLGHLGEQDAIEKCTFLCEKKGMEYFDNHLSYSGSVSTEKKICKCIDDTGELKEFER